MALATAAGVAGATAAAMYVNARYHIQKDLRALLGLRRARKLYEKAVQENRHSLYYLFEKSALRLQDAECLWSREGCYTWTEAYQRANQYGHWFLSRGVKPGDLVGFYLMNSPDFILAWAGLWSIGAAPAMINYNLAGKALIHCLKISGATILLVGNEPDLQVRIKEVSGEVDAEYPMNMIVLDLQIKSEVATMATESPDHSLRAQVKGNWPMCLFYTSGTTGMPKGCKFTVQRGFERGVLHEAGLSISLDEDRWYNCMPLYHGTGGVTAISQLMEGITLCIGKKFSTSNFWSDIRDSKATWFVYVGETARYLLATPPSPLDKAHSVRGMYGNGLRPDVWIKFRERFGISEVFEFFNSTEGVFGLAVHAKGDFLATSVGHHGMLLRLFTKNVFVPIRIDQATGDIVRDPETGFAYRESFEKGGEIIVAASEDQAGGEAFSGYYKNPEATAKKYVTDVFKKGDRWYRTGDALRRTNDGLWFFMDRLGDTFRWKGENVSTAQVAEVLGNFPGIVEANVYGVSLPNHDGRAGCAAIYIDPKERDTFDLAGFLKHSRTHLPRYAIPVFLRVVQEMTPIHNNKQNKVPLREEGVDPSKVKQGDQILWVRDGGKTYGLFTPGSWDQLCAGRARL